MPRPDQLQFLLYPPSKEILEEWREESEKFGTSLSNYIVEMVERSRRAEGAETKIDLSKELSELKEENKKLREELRYRIMVLEKCETELFRLRNQDFLDPQFRAVLNPDLMKLLQGGRTWNSTALLEALGVDPHDSDSARIIYRQLQLLRDLGLANETSKGWRWVG